MKIHSILASLSVAGVLGLSSPAWAVSTWTLSPNCTGGTGFGNTLTCTGGPSTLSVTAWSDTATTFAAAEARGDAQGLGVRNVQESANSFILDNATPGRDMLLLSFGSAVSLNALSLGYVLGDSDLSVLAYTSSTGSGTSSVAGKTASQLVNGGGWSLVSQVAGGTAAGDRTFNSAGTFTSSWWLISAYNSSFGGTALTGTDYVKLLSVAGNIVAPPSSGKTPEPASLALVGLGMMGAWGMRRRSRKTAV